MPIREKRILLIKRNLIDHLKPSTTIAEARQRLKSEDIVLYCPTQEEVLSIMGLSSRNEQTKEKESQIEG